ncbi:MAG: ABC transporter permease [Anaerolineales bacterium]|nr:ABC transporter permease [Anaerolineales bacterium]
MGSEGIVSSGNNPPVPMWMKPLPVVLTLVLWEAVTRLSFLPAYLLPSPEAVALRLIQTIQSGVLLQHVAVTLQEVLAGLALGLAIATALGTLLAKSPVAEKLLSPYIVASQSIPTVAIAPLLVIWFGPGKLSKILISSLLVFFPVLVNTMVGIRSVPEDLHDLMRILKATRWQVFTRLELPAAMPVYLGGVRVGATLSVIGAVVGEFVGADEGLGFLINVARGMYDTALVFAAVFVLIALALGLYGLVTLIERRVLSWQSI